MAPTTSIAAASIVPFDPTVGITAVASVAVLLTVLIMAFLALAPIVSEGWGARLGSTEATANVEANEAD